MSTQRYTPEFKEEAVRQVVELGYPVSDGCGPAWVSAYPLHQWVKAVIPTKDEKQSAELIEAKSEILRLRSQIRRLKEERDLLERLHCTLPGSQNKVPVHERASIRVFARVDVPDFDGTQSRILPIPANFHAFPT